MTQEHQVEEEQEEEEAVEVLAPVREVARDDSGKVLI